MRLTEQELLDFVYSNEQECSKLFEKVALYIRSNLLVLIEKEQYSKVEQILEIIFNKMRTFGRNRHNALNKMIDKIYWSDEGDIPRETIELLETHETLDDFFDVYFTLHKKLNLEEQDYDKNYVANMFHHISDYAYAKNLLNTNVSLNVLRILEREEHCLIRFDKESFRELELDYHVYTFQGVVPEFCIGDVCTDFYVHTDTNDCSYSNILENIKYTLENRDSVKIYLNLSEEDFKTEPIQYLIDFFKDVKNKEMLRFKFGKELFYKDYSNLILLLTPCNLI